MSSPLARARSAAEDYARQCGCALRIDADWAELDFGRWDGRLRSKIASEPDGAELLGAFYHDPAAFTAPGGEGWLDVKQRVAARSIGSRNARSRVGAGGERMAAPSAPRCPSARLAAASLWSLRVNPGTRISIEAGRAEDGAPWAEIVEISQP